MKTDFDDAITSTFEHIVATAPETGPAPSPATAPLPVSPSRRPVLVAAAVVFVVGVGTVAFAIGGGSTGDRVVADGGPTTTAASVQGDDGPGIPGMSLSTSSEATGVSAASAQRYHAALGDGGWTVELREHASRGVAPGVVVQWAHYLDGDRRVFIVEGPGDTVDTTPLTETVDGHVWPEERGAATVMVRSADRAVIVRSETVDGSGQPRSLQELFVLARQIAASPTAEAFGGLTMTSAGEDQSYPLSTLERSDPEAAGGPYSVVIRRLDGNLGEGSAVVTYVKGEDGADAGIVTNPSTGASTLIEPIAGGHLEVRGVALGNEEIRDIASATSIVDGYPFVDLPASLDLFDVIAQGSQRPLTIREARYGCDALDEDVALGALCYTGLTTSPGFEDAVYRGAFEPGPDIDGHASVISRIGGGNATLAWEPQPGLIAYIGYSGNERGDDQTAAMERLANRVTLLTEEEWSATEPQIVIQTNSW